MGGLLVPVLALVGFVVMAVLDAATYVRAGWAWLTERPARRRVRLAAEGAAAERIGELVPEQRQSPECVVIPFQRRPR